MATELIAEYRPITAVPLLRVRGSTSTGMADADLPTSRATLGSVAWGIIDQVPPRYSRAGMASYEFAKALWVIPEVLAVTHAVDRGVNLIWTFIAQRDKTLRRRIYDRELKLMGDYPDLTFNFHVAALGQGASESVMQDFETRLVMSREPGV